MTIKKIVENFIYLDIFDKIANLEKNTISYYKAILDLWELFKNNQEFRIKFANN